MENEKRVDIVFSIGGFQVFRKMPVDKDLLEVVAVACEVRNIPCPVELCPFRIFFTAKPRISAGNQRVISVPILFFFFTAIYSSLVALKERSDFSATFMFSELCELSVVAFSELCELSVVAFSELCELSVVAFSELCELSVVAFSELCELSVVAFSELCELSAT